MSNPKLRFKKADGQSFQDTVACTLGDISEYSKRITEKENILFIGNEHLISNFGGALLTIRDNAKGIEFNGNDVLLGNIRPYLKKVWLATQSGIASPDVLVFRATKSIPGYLKCILSSERFFNHVAQGYKGSKMPRGDKQQIMDFKIQSPCLEEQQKIASYFSTLDAKIILSERKLEALDRLKKGLMQKIFSKEAQFKQEDGAEFPEWRLYSFAEVFEFVKSFALSRSFLTNESGDVKNIHYGDILVNLKTILKSDSEEIPCIKSEYLPEDLSLLRAGDVIFADTAEDYTVGKAVELIDDARPVTAGLHTIACRPRMKFYPAFLGYYLNSESFRRQLIPLVTGTKVMSIIKSEIVKTKLEIPSYDEQKRIASLFLTLDERISKLKRKLQLLRELKKGFMQQMFV